MPKGQSIPESMCWTVVRMTTCSYTPEQIQAFTDVSHRQQRCIIKVWQATDDVREEKVGHKIQGRPRHLTMEDIAVSKVFILPGGMYMHQSSLFDHSSFKALSIQLVTCI
jgi:hypothetical protein